MISENIHIVREKIARAAEKAGRNPEEITLVAVSKTEPISAIEEALNAGVKDFGENKAQEFRDKYEILGDKVAWHFIGHLQTNKVKYVVGKAKLVHSVDSVKLAAAINERAAKLGVKQAVLLEVNVSGEETKYGIRDENDLLEIAEFCVGAENLDLRGIMTMAPFTEDETVIRKTFSVARAMKETLENKGFRLPHLSMGMTNDYEIAIEEGATIVRIGTAIFGERDYSKAWNEK